MQNIGQDTIKNLVVPLPPLDEQRLIAQSIVERSQRLDGLIEAAENVIARLAEYRAALITAVTTGKIDVRNLLTPVKTS